MRGMQPVPQGRKERHVSLFRFDLDLELGEVGFTPFEIVIEIENCTFAFDFVKLRIQILYKP